MATVSNNDIALAIYGVLEGKAKSEQDATLHRVVQFLKKRQLLSKSKQILESLDQLINKKENKIIVKVISARKLEEKTKKELSKLLSQKYPQKEITLKEKLDDRMLGGVRLEIGDEVIDLTMKRKILKLQAHLTKNYE